jgi:nicotinamide phosphoribosyltransferase
MNTKLIAEAVFLQDLITRKFPTGVVSVVCDSFDFWAVLTDILPALKDVIMARESAGAAPGKLVIRPDSGDPVKVVCGYSYDEVKFRDGKYYIFDIVSDKNGSPEVYTKEISESEVKGSIECLWEVFGGTVTEKGYKLLDSHVGLIYGDSITLDRAEQICEGLKQKFPQQKHLR